MSETMVQTQLNQCNCPMASCDGYDNHYHAKINPHANLEEYFPIQLLDKLAIKPSEGSTQPEDYIERVIYNFMHNIEEEIDTDKLIELITLRPARESFYYMPIIIYILQKRYDKYFIKEEQV